MLSRRTFLKRSTGALLGAAAIPARAAQATALDKVPFHLLYGNDTTNLVECTSPFHPKGAPFDPAMIGASVDEARAADAHFLQPGLTWVPLWKSKLYSADAHFRWWRETFRGRMHPLGDYMMGGGDVVQVFVAHCRRRQVAPFLSVRLNDYHRIESLDVPPGTHLQPFDSLGVDRFRREHPEWRLESPENKAAAPGEQRYGAIFAAREGQVMNWARPEVRERIFGFLTELAEGYAIAGLELDFMRHFRFFRLGETTPQERSAIMTGFVGRVRALLDRTSAAGAPRWLCVRVPAVQALHDPLGVDVGAMAGAGVEMFNLSSNYYTVQQGHDLAAIRARVPSAACYLEMTHCTAVGADPARKSGDSSLFRRTTPEQLTTTAELAYAKGAHGVSLFNFAYYREYGAVDAKSAAEPPFEVLPWLTDRAALPQRHKHFFLATAWSSVYGNPTQLPRTVKAGQKVELHFDLTGTIHGPGTFRLQAEASLDGTQWEVRCRGEALAADADTAEPYGAPYPPLLGTSETLRAWRVPQSMLAGGSLKVELSLAAGSAAKIVFVDLACG